MAIGRILFGVKAVAAAGTAVALTSSPTWVSQVRIMAKKVGGDNTGNVYIGDSTVDQSSKQGIELANGESHEIYPMPGGHQVNLADIYVDAATNADGVVYVAVV